MNSLGWLPRNDPMWVYLWHDILPLVTGTCRHADFRVYSMPVSPRVYLYEDPDSRIRIVGKFFGSDAGRSHTSCVSRMDREFNNLNLLRGLGFDRYPHYVARPLGRNSRVNCVLVEEFCQGRCLADVIRDAIEKQDTDTLFAKLTDLARFLGTLHQRGERDNAVDFDACAAYFKKIVKQLKNWNLIDSDRYRQFSALRRAWMEKPFMERDRQVLVHGDLTPANILFGDSPWVITFDLERVKLSDRVFDAGAMAGELKHFFMKYAGDGLMAEPFIGHFLWEYAGCFPDRSRVFETVTARVPFYMGMTLLRICRNSWISRGYRRKLLDEAAAILAFP